MLLMLRYARNYWNAIGKASSDLKSIYGPNRISSPRDSDDLFVKLAEYYHWKFNVPKRMFPLGMNPKNFN
jgi:hypothetical protein